MQVNVTPFQQVAFAQRGFPLPEVQPRGREFVAFSRRDDGQWVEVIARSPEVAIQQLALLVNKPAPKFDA